MKLKDIQKKKTNKIAFISARVSLINSKFFKKNRIDMELLLDKLRHDAQVGEDAL